jgi:6-phosphogluconolactonase (cycloisomerase 2 family)
MRIQVRSLLAVIVAFSALSWGLPDTALPLADAASNAESEDATASTVDIGVTVPADQWDSGPNAPSSGCSLREALARAGNEQGGDRGCGPASTAGTANINIPPGTYVLTVEDQMPNIGSGLTVNISGPSANPPALVIDGGSQQSRHWGIFHIVGGRLNLKYVTLRHGSRPGGGAIWQDGGVFTADHVTFKDNDAAATNDLTQDGGAILTTTGDLTVTNSVFNNNVALGNGGAVSTAFGYFFKDDFIDNQATAGGALEIHTSTTFPVYVVESKFKDNKARPSPFNDPSPGYTSSSDPNGGGAILNSGNLRLTKVLIKDNHSELSKGGGGLLNEGLAILTECVITNNNALAKASGDVNASIQNAWGGGIFNSGDLDLIRCSVHNNQADYAAAIFNHAPGELEIFNSTIGNNSARKAYGGLMNEHSLFDNTVSNGAEVHLYHATLGKNGSQSNSAISAIYDRSVRFGNSILDGGCNVVQYTVGRSVMTDFCQTVPDPTIDLFASADLSGTSQFQLGLQGLTGGNSSVPEFQVQPIDGGSVAVDIGRNDAYGCDHPNIHRVDQNNQGRGGTHCDAGAYEAAQQPPQFGSTPNPGRINFPDVDFSLGQGGSLVSLVLRNTGGGAFDYAVVDEDFAGNSGVVLESSPTGTLFRNSQTTLTFHCAPPSEGDHWKTISIHTEPNIAQPSYTFRCTGVNQTQQASMSEPPGAKNMPMTPPGMTSHSTVVMRNPAHMPLMSTYGLKNSDGIYGLMPVVAEGQAGPQAPDAPAVTINPGQSLTLDLSCTPNGYSVFVNTLIFTTTDPINPHIEYNLACEQIVDNPPEALSLGGEYLLGVSNFTGMAVSPDGAQVVAGEFDGIVRKFLRNAASGALVSDGSVSSPGMSQVYGVQYSHDGKNVYYTSHAGDGVVTLSRSNNALSISQVITSGTKHVCGVNPPIFCPIGTLDGARGVAVSPDHQNVYVTGNVSGTLNVFRRLSGGNLSFAQAITRTINGVNVLGGAARVTTSPDGLHIYVVSISDDSLAVFQRQENGHLDFQAVYKDGVGGLNNFDQPADAVVSPDGQFVYATSFVDNALNIFSRGPSDGLLSLVQSLIVSGPYGLALSPDNEAQRLYLALYGQDKLRVYARNPISGTLTTISTTSGINGPTFLAVSPDDKDVYVSLYDGQAVRHLASLRNPPILQHISPASAPAGGAGFQLTAVGGSFYPDSKIVWGGTVLTTQFVSEHELRANITAGQIAAEGNVNVLVRNTAPGGGDSAAKPFVRAGPAVSLVPSIEGIDPPEATFSGEDLVVLLHGANFAPDAQAFYNLWLVPTLFINDHTLRVTLPADIMLTPGEGGLQVVNGGGYPSLGEAAMLNAPDSPEAAAASKTSTAVGFTVRASVVPAQPALTSLVPASAISGSASIWITVVGQNFSADASTETVGRWNGQARASVVQDEHVLLMKLNQADLAAAGNALVTAFTPGTGESQPLSFHVRLTGEKPVPVAASIALKTWTLYVNGSDFDPAAQIRINGTPRPTTFVNSDRLQMTLNPSDHGAVISVFNPGPGGGLSNELVAFFSHLFLPAIRR